MPEPIFPKLTLITVSIIPAFPGMIDLNNLEDLQFDPGLDSHPRAHKRIKKMIHEFVEESLRLAHESGIGDPKPSQGIRIAVLPSRRTDGTLLRLARKGWALLYRQHSASPPYCLRRQQFRWL